MYKILMALVAFFVSGLEAEAAPLERDEREIIRSAHVFHIMGASLESMQTLRAQLTAVPEDQLLGEFTRLAREKSSDVGSASSGGDLGLVVEGSMDEQFESAVFSLQPMRISSPHRSAYGWHLVMVASVQQQSVRDVCVRSLQEAQKTAPITPDALYRFSIERQSPASLHPDALQFIGEGWGPPLNWKDNLAYWRVESDPDPGMTRLVIHSEMPFAILGSSPRGCRRSERDVFLVDCAARTVALISHAEYEGRGAAGRRLMNTVFGPDKRTFQPANAGFLAQVERQACMNVTVASSMP
ncbi:peptidylprolyl isomerase [Leptothrix sp. BB-4]